MHRSALLLLALASLATFTGCAAEDSDDVDSASPEVNERLSADDCLDGQDMNAPDVDISRCPTLPSTPRSARVRGGDVSLGAWELGTTSTGEHYKYGSISSNNAGEYRLNYESTSAAVNDENIQCWAKGYYRLRNYLKAPPREWLALRSAGFQGRFFQFQTDLRNGPTGFRRLTSYQNHLVKWVTVIDANGVCQQPTLDQFRDYAKSELDRRGLPQPE